MIDSGIASPAVDEMSLTYRAPGPIDLGTRANTRALRQAAAERAIGVMRDRMSEPLSHDDMAHAAFLSRYHFNRVFTLITGMPPIRFLTAIRMAEARRLLLTTDLRVTDICFQVGFESLGTFTTRFGDLVGVPPQQLRCLQDRHGGHPIDSLLGAVEPSEVPPAPPGLRGRIEAPAAHSYVAIVGVFTRDGAQGLPVACTVARAPGAFATDAIPKGNYRVLAVGYPCAATIDDAMLMDSTGLVVMRTSKAIASAADRWLDLRLRPTYPTDPPVVLAAPLLAAEQLAARSRHRLPAVGQPQRSTLGQLWLTSPH